MILNGVLYAEIQMGSLCNMDKNIVAFPHSIKHFYSVQKVTFGNGIWTASDVTGDLLRA